VYTILDSIGSILYSSGSTLFSFVSSFCYKVGDSSLITSSSSILIEIMGVGFNIFGGPLIAIIAISLSEVGLYLWQMLVPIIINIEKKMNCNYSYNLEYKLVGKKGEGTFSEVIKS
jgi:glucose dehydrogenase